MTNVQLINAVRRQSVHAACSGKVSDQPDLELLAYLAKTARPSARSVSYRGIRWPVRHNLWARIVCCPNGDPLVGVVDL